MATSDLLRFIFFLSLPNLLSAILNCLLCILTRGVSFECSSHKDQWMCENYSTESDTSWEMNTFLFRRKNKFSILHRNDERTHCLTICENLCLRSKAYMLYWSEDKIKVSGFRKAYWRITTKLCEKNSARPSDVFLLCIL